MTVTEENGGNGRIEVDATLVAAGRKPNMESLALEKAGVAVTEKGFISVDNTLPTSVPHIWAMMSTGVRNLR
ncbi:FAD-dependent oxidoreductase [Paenibacillus sepulcri]|uniref:FAD-dependent oxidoreductase n=1 Tax=Paenibacillus sepulcri TaxID=359917 RepID=UPI0035EE8389